MEDTLEVAKAYACSTMNTVLILVLMEDTLEAALKYSLENLIWLS